MTRFAIAEDDPSFRNDLKNALMRYAKENDLKISLSVFDDGDALLHADEAFDVILMDIEMPHMDGMTAAKELRKTDSSAIIIFITNMSQYAIEGYSVDALDYLLKPLTYYAFSQCMNRAMLRLKKRETRSLLIAHQHGARRIDSDSILFVEVHGHSLIYHTLEGDFTVAGTMKEVEESLLGLPFFRCNKCDLVNLTHVDGIRDGDALVGSFVVQLSRAKKKGFLEALNRYVNEVRP